MPGLCYCWAARVAVEISRDTWLLRLATEPRVAKRDDPVVVWLPTSHGDAGLVEALLEREIDLFGLAPDCTYKVSQAISDKNHNCNIA